MNYVLFLEKILLALVLGFSIGLERQLTGHSVGIRINVLICMGTCFFTQFPMLYASDQMFRLGASIISGVGFLCSAVIFKENGVVKGMNTAATLWCTASIGLLASTENPLYSIIATTILIGSNLLLRPLAKKIKPIYQAEDFEVKYEVSITCYDKSEWEIRGLLMRALSVKELYLTTIESSDVLGDKVEVKATYTSIGKSRDHIVEEIVGECLKNTSVISGGWEVI